MIDESVEPHVSPSRVSTLARPWHLADHRFDGLDVFSRESTGAETPLVLAGATTFPGGSGDTRGMPLWERLLTGKSFGWRLRSYRNKARARARRAARRPAQFLQLRPDLRRLLEQGRWLSAMRLILSRPNGAHRGRSARGVIDAAVVIDRSARHHPLARSLRKPTDHRVARAHAEVELTSTSQQKPARARPNVLVSSVDRPDATCVVKSGSVLAGGDALVDAVNDRYWCPVGFPQRPTMGERRVSDLLGRRHRTQHAARAALALTWQPDDVSDVLTWARVITDLAAAGAPLWTSSISGSLRTLLGESLATAITRPSGVSDLRDVRIREMHSVEVRRAALGTHAPRARWGDIVDRMPNRRSLVASQEWDSVRPTVSVLLATKRPDDLAQALTMVRRQTHQRLQLVVGLHGSAWTDDAERAVQSAGLDDVRIRRFDSSLNLGEVLAGLTGLADGEFVTKWDDDDWYGTDHILDLLLASDYTGADLVGKAAEFVRLESIDLTIRRFAQGAESMSTTIAGGALFLRRSVLADVGGWPSAARQVDRLLIDSILRDGGAVYRTHGFGYVLRRRSEGHTWSVEDGYFLRQASDQRRGLDLGFAGIERLEGDVD
jgi:hypothetical protein